MTEYEQWTQDWDRNLVVGTLVMDDFHGEKVACTMVFSMGEDGVISDERARYTESHTTAPQSKKRHRRIVSALAQDKLTLIDYPQDDQNAFAHNMQQGNTKHRFFAPAP